MVAIVTIIGIGGAYAMTPPSNQANHTYGVLSTGTNFYHVTTSSDGMCLSNPSSTCKIVSAATPDANGNILKSAVISSTPGDYPQ